MEIEWKNVSDELPELEEIYKSGPRISKRVLIFNQHDNSVSVGHYEDHADRKRTTGWWDDTQPDWVNIRDRDELMSGIMFWAIPEGPKIPF